jgi:hypothetical protein
MTPMKNYAEGSKAAFRPFLRKELVSKKQLEATRPHSILVNQLLSFSDALAAVTIYRQSFAT